MKRYNLPNNQFTNGIVSNPKLCDYAYFSNDILWVDGVPQVTIFMFTTKVDMLSRISGDDVPCQIRQIEVVDGTDNDGINQMVAKLISKGVVSTTNDGDLDIDLTGAIIVL